MRRGRLGTVGYFAVIAAFALCMAPPTRAQQSPPDYAAALKTWTYSLAMAAANYGAPLVTIYALRDNDAVGAKAKARPNAVWRMEDISTPELSKEAGYVTPNVDVIYGFTIYIQSDNPGPDKESNWLPSPPGRVFYLIPRAYTPAQATINILSDPHSWPVPVVVSVK